MNIQRALSVLRRVGCVVLVVAGSAKAPGALAFERSESHGRVDRSVQVLDCARAAHGRQLSQSTTAIERSDIVASRTIHPGDIRRAHGGRAVAPNAKRRARAVRRAELRLGRRARTRGVRRRARRTGRALRRTARRRRRSGPDLPVRGYRDRAAPLNNPAATLRRTSSLGPTRRPRAAVRASRCVHRRWARTRGPGRCLDRAVRSRQADAPITSPRRLPSCP